MNASRRYSALLAARFVDDSFRFWDGISEDGYRELMDSVANMRIEEFRAVKNLARHKDKDERSAEYHAAAMEAFPHFQAAHDELRAGLETGEWDPELVIEELRAAANATGAKPAANSKKKSKKDLVKRRA